MFLFWSCLGLWVLDVEDNCCLFGFNLSGLLGMSFYIVLGDVRDLGLINYIFFKLTLEKWEIDFFDEIIF